MQSVIVDSQEEEMSERVRGGEGEVERSHLDIDNDDDKIGPAMVSS